MMIGNAPLGSKEEHKKPQKLIYMMKDSFQTYQELEIQMWPKQKFDKLPRHSNKVYPTSKLLLS